MYTAIVLNTKSQKACKIHAGYLDLLYSWDAWKVRLHHITLGMGNKGKFALGCKRRVLVTHYGILLDRVTAFKVECPESENKTPHITIATARDAKPAESNLITNWIELKTPFWVEGVIELCE